MQAWAPIQRTDAELAAANLDLYDWARHDSSERTGRRIDEEDYPRLSTLADTVAFLAAPV
jgi:hypothetical protein